MMHIELDLDLFSVFCLPLSIDFVMVILFDIEISVGHKGEGNLEALIRSERVGRSKPVLLDDT